MNKGKSICKAILYVIIALVAIRLLTSTFKSIIILAIILYAIYFAWKEFKR